MVAFDLRSRAFEREHPMMNKRKRCVDLLGGYTFPSKICRKSWAATVMNSTASARQGTSSAPSTYIRQHCRRPLLLAGHAISTANKIAATPTTKSMYLTHSTDYVAPRSLSFHSSAEAMISPHSSVRIPSWAHLRSLGVPENNKTRTTIHLA